MPALLPTGAHRNLEVKARVRDLDDLRRRATRLATRPPAREHQVDEYFEVDARGQRRVKRRTSSRFGVQLIAYRRPEEGEVRVSDYQLYPEGHPGYAELAARLGQPVLTVTKDREVLWFENVRLHLDHVEGLGEFFELEAVVDDQHDEATCQARIAHLMEALGPALGERLTASYSDLLAARGAASDAGASGSPA